MLQTGVALSYANPLVWSYARRAVNQTKPAGVLHMAPSAVESPFPPLPPEYQT